MTRSLSLLGLGKLVTVKVVSMFLPEKKQATVRFFPRVGDWVAAERLKVAVEVTGWVVHIRVVLLK